MRGSTTGSVMAVLLVVPHVAVVAVVPGEGDDEKDGEGEEEQVAHATFPTIVLASPFLQRHRSRQARKALNFTSVTAYGMSR